MNRTLFEEKYGSDQLTLWKKQYGNIFGYVSHDGLSCVLRSPDLNIIDACRAIAGNSAVKFDTALVDNCWLAGDEELRSQDKYRMGLFDWLGVIITKVEGELGEL